MQLVKNDGMSMCFPTGFSFQLSQVTFLSSSPPLPPQITLPSHHLLSLSCLSFIALLPPLLQLSCFSFLQCFRSEVHQS